MNAFAETYQDPDCPYVATVTYDPTSGLSVTVQATVLDGTPDELAAVAEECDRRMREIVELVTATLTPWPAWKARVGGVD